LLTTRKGRVTSRFFEDFYVDRNTVSSLLVRAEVHGTSVAWADLSREWSNTRCRHFLKKDSTRSEAHSFGGRCACRLHSGKVSQEVLPSAAQDGARACRPAT
jgi:hypothetical protein